ncbi:hypothetical protein LAZ67_X002906 [Cordylochernes scorpioides]|uniref:Endonuclease/exonuclease/phosphatase domain-containing protein n=1 Tax=Cordylochernes scorpioides TaxID=51811 RepID=A0ABY6LYL6_9ARAC|nr:hypothetical protein LAZ67_X002906 [Cordylochernes scorpioides]
MTKNLPIKWIVFLAGIFNAALHLCYFPKTWKHAIIITIPKKSPVKSPEDLRPISLLSTIGKDGAIPFGVAPTNAEISAENNSVENVSNSETNEKYAKSPVTSGGYANSPQTSRNWADIVGNESAHFDHSKKRKRSPASERVRQPQPGPSRQTEATRDSTAPRQPSCPRNIIEQMKVSRQMLDQCRSKAAVGTFDQMVYLEYTPEFTSVDYIKALENKLGKSCVFQLGKASGQVLVGLERPEMAETIIEDGLMVKGALLKALSYQKKAEKITISGLPYVIEDADIIRTLRPYCQVVSIAPAVNYSGGYTWLDLKKTAFILMNNGKKITDLPKKIVVTAKGGSALAYFEYGFRCSKCYRMGHKRIIAPGSSGRQIPSNPRARRATFSTPPIQEAKVPETGRTTRTPETSTQTDLNISRGARKNFRLACLNVRGFAARHRSIELCCFLGQHAVDVAFIQETNVTTLHSVEDLCLGYRAEVIGQRVLSPGKIDAFDVTIRGIKATFINCHLSHAPNERLQQLQAIAAAAVNEDAWVLGDLNISEESASDIASESVEALGELLDRANLVGVTTLESVEDLCLGYRAEVVAASGSRGSGLACIFSSGVQVFGQKVLHAAVNENAWVLGDLNISEESASEIASGSVEALGELLDRANLVDAAAIFDAAHLPTRISSCGRRVDASRLDRVLLPSRLSNRVTRYWSLYYKNSDHRAVLLQIGEATEPRSPCIASMLRSRLVVGRVETLLNEAFGNIEDMQNAEIWRRRIRPRPSSPSMTCATTTTTTSLGQENMSELSSRMSSDHGTSGERLGFRQPKGAFSHPTCSPEDIDGFLRGFTLRVTIEESDPLHRYGIGEEEIATAIGRLPTGKAAVWDDLPFELFRGFEDFFASALRRVFEASQLCGALPSSMRRSEIVLSGVLYWRLRPHLRDIVPECQSYAAPGRTPAWNISRVADEVATACREEIPLAVVATDLESAVDTLNRGFLMSVLLCRSAASLRGVGSSTLRWGRGDGEN